MIVVVGSGPAGVACASALLARGVSVEMLDAGIELEPDRKEPPARLAASAPEKWDPADVAAVKSNVRASRDGLPRKILFGSDFPYQKASEFFPAALSGVHVIPSFARGGLSTVWGAAVLPYLAEEIQDWPVTLSELDPHYRAVTKLMPFAGAHDDLETRFPLYSDRPEKLQLSRQAEAFLSDLSTHRSELQKSGVSFGRSRLAVQAPSTTDSSGCVYCGLCMYGCPYQYIYSSEQTLNVLRGNPRFKYQKGIVVKRLEETGGTVQIFAEKLADRAAVTLSGERVFLAAGILPTTQILLESLQAYDHPLTMRYSQHFMFPLWRSKSEPGVLEERLHTLAQLFLEVNDPEVSGATIHLQVYTYNDLFEEALKKAGLGVFLKISPGLRRWVLGKLLLVQGYLHSRYSEAIQIQLARPDSGEATRLKLSGHVGGQVRSQLKKLLQKLSGLKKLLGATPLSLGIRISPPGQGFHNVGTFPMKKAPQAFESDIWGRPYGLTRVHAVDATVLPSTPATTITLSVMANAHRIGAEAEL